MFYTYILKSLKDGSYYKGSTSDLKERLAIHNKGKSKYSKAHRPFVVHYFEEFETRSEAYRRERFFKSFQGHIWLKDNNII